MALQLLLTWAALAVCARAQPPIPDVGNSGYLLSKPVSCSQGSGFRIEIFGDFQCPDTKALWQTILEPLLSEERYTNGGSFVFHAFPLPYHRSGFTSAQAVRVLTKHLTGAEFKKIGDTFFSHQSEFQTDVTQNLSDSSITSDIFAPLALGLGVPKAVFLDGMANEAINGEVRVAWKMGSMRGVYGTPTVAINGVISGVVGQWNLTQWKAWLDKEVGNAGGRADASSYHV
mmetsp:Transcript_30697/g.55694  ORF Transcript_30697/g.55694 Transcript_30697/m.55694 type:complete len:230 (-) Transcript_30697:3-692(-)